MNFEISMNRGLLLIYNILISFTLPCFSGELEINKFSGLPQSDTTFINLRDFGLEKTRKKDCTTIINQAISEINDSTPTVIQFPRGEYHFYNNESIKRNYVEGNSPEKKLRNCAILFENKNNIIIDGNGSTLIFHSQLQAFTFDNCRNIILKNLKIDWEQPFLAQGKVLKVNTEFIELGVDLKETPYQIENGKLYFSIDRNVNEIWKNTVEFDREGRYIVPITGDSLSLGDGWENYIAENIIPGVIRLYYPFSRKPKIGNMLILRHTKQNHPGIFIQESENIEIKNVSIYHSTGIGTLAESSKNLTFDGYSVIPNIIKSRYFSGIGNGLKITNCTGEITIYNCEFEGLMCAPLSIHTLANQTPVNSETQENEQANSLISISNSSFTGSRESSIQISAVSNVTISNNYFESSGSAILIEENAKNIKIENNEFTELCNSNSYEFCEGIISLYPEITLNSESTPQVYKNIQIINNRFNPFDYPVLFARSVEGLNFENNTINRSTRFEPFHNKIFTFTFEGCKNILLNNNTISEDVLGKNIQLKWMYESELNCSQSELTITRMNTSE